MRRDTDLFNTHATYSAIAPWVEIVQTTSGKVVASINPKDAHPRWRRVGNHEDLSRMLPDDARRLAASIWKSWTCFSRYL